MHFRHSHHHREHRLCFDQPERPHMQNPEDREKREVSLDKLGKQAVEAITKHVQHERATLEAYHKQMSISPDRRPQRFQVEVEGNFDAIRLQMQISNSLVQLGAQFNTMPGRREQIRKILREMNRPLATVGKRIRLSVTDDGRIAFVIRRMRLSEIRSEIVTLEDQAKKNPSAQKRAKQDLLSLRYAEESLRTSPEAHFRGHGERIFTHFLRGNDADRKHFTEQQVQDVIEAATEGIHDVGPHNSISQALPSNLWKQNMAKIREQNAKLKTYNETMRKSYLAQGEAQAKLNYLRKRTAYIKTMEMEEIGVEWMDQVAEEIVKNEKQIKQYESVIRKYEQVMDEYREKAMESTKIIQNYQHSIDSMQESTAYSRRPHPESRLRRREAEAEGIPLPSPQDIQELQWAYNRLLETNPEQAHKLFHDLHTRLLRLGVLLEKTRNPLPIHAPIGQERFDGNQPARHWQKTGANEWTCIHRQDGSEEALTWTDEEMQRNTGRILTLQYELTIHTLELTNSEGHNEAEELLFQLEADWREGMRSIHFPQGTALESAHDHDVTRTRRDQVAALRTFLGNERESLLKEHPEHVLQHRAWRVANLIDNGYNPEETEVRQAMRDFEDIYNQLYANHTVAQRNAVATFTRRSGAFRRTLLARGYDIDNNARNDTRIILRLVRPATRSAEAREQQRWSDAIMQYRNVLRDQYRPLSTEETRTTRRQGVARATQELCKVYMGINDILARPRFREQLERVLWHINYRLIRIEPNASDPDRQIALSYVTSAYREYHP